MSLHNMGGVTTTTTGTGTITLGSAIAGYNTFAGAGVVNSEVISYTIIDGVNFECGIGTYTSSGTTLSRTVIRSSSNAGSAINLSGNALVYLSLHAEDIPQLLAVTSYNPSTQTTVNTTSTTGADVDATNLSITFTVPASGKVLIELNAMAFQSNAGIGYLWILRTTGGSNVAGTKQYVTGNVDGTRIICRIYITGLTPGASITYRWGHLVQANTGSIRYGDDGSTANQAGAATMTAWSAP